MFVEMNVLESGIYIDVKWYDYDLTLSCVFE